MKNIIVPCDFSRPSVYAFQLALSIAAKSGGSVYLLNVQPLPMTYDAGLSPALYLENEMIKGILDHASGELTKLRKAHTEAGVTVLTQVEFGDVCDKTLEIAKSEEVDLVIMGSHGLSGFNEHVIGSNVSKMIRRSSIPVLIVKNHVTKTIKNIVFPTNLNQEEDLEFLAHLEKLQVFFDAQIHMVWINTPENFEMDSIVIPKMKALALQFHLRNYSLNIYNSIGEIEGINEFTASIDGDLIAMGTHARMGIGRLLSGSVTESVAYRSESPIWTFDLQAKS
jgi:nucleotide-binding universal stress UspA family protein